MSSCSAHRPRAGRGAVGTMGSQNTEESLPFSPAELNLNLEWRGGREGRDRAVQL